jgi:hypothetical protein
MDVCGGLCRVPHQPAMTDVARPPGWWLASDGNWYPPHLHPQARGQILPTPSGPSGADPRTPPRDSIPGSIPALPRFAPFAPPPGSPPVAPSPYGFSYPSPSAPPFGAGPGIGYPVSTNGLAIASLVLSIVTLFGIGSLLGIIFGFVSRSQIRRSNGTRKGAGLALAGIIIGFVTFGLVLLAIAIPTFIGVRTDTPAATSLPPNPIVLGTPQQGGQAPPITWETRSQPYDTTLTPVPAGVEMNIGSPGASEWAAVPVADGFPSIQVSAAVAIVAGTRSNGIGLGCVTPTQSARFAFLVYASGEWQVLMTVTNGEAMIITSGTTPLIRSGASNSLIVACSDDPARPGNTQVSFEINGTPVTNDLVGLGSDEWIPTVQGCSCDGTDTDSFTNLAYYASPDTATSTG